MKRKAQEPQRAAPVSAIAARRGPSEISSSTSESGRRLLKKARLSSGLVVKPDDEVQVSLEDEDVCTRRQGKTEGDPRKSVQPRPEHVVTDGVAEELWDGELEEDNNIILESDAEDTSGSDGQSNNSDEFILNAPVATEDFLLSKTRMTSSSVVYSNKSTICVRIREKMNLILVGIYDIWIRRGVISLMGAKLFACPKLFRVFAPSTHSLPVIKCVSGIEGYAEIEVRSCFNGICRLRGMSPLYDRIWNSGSTVADKETFKSSLQRTFSILYSSSDDPLKRNLRPLHLEKKWSVAIKVFSQRAAGLRVLICGPKSSGKSTLSRYLLNHLLSPTPQEGSRRDNTDGVAFLDLDPGQPEFSPMGQIYLAHLRNPLFGPPFSHPTLAGSHNGAILRAHHIGATSPKEDPDHYVLAAMNLMDCYQTLLNSYPQCPLIINYPGWIFGPGLEIAVWFVKSLGISDVVYMSEKGPDEVIGQLSQAAREAGVALTTLPSQPISFMTRSSSQLRSMQIQSYFHMSHPREAQSPVWSQIPLSRQKPIYVNYAGERQGILGVMVQGNQHDPNLLFDILHGAIVGIVVVENLSAIARNQEKLESGGGIFTNLDDHEDENMCEVEDDIITREQGTRRSDSLMESFISRTPREGLPYLFVGNGSCTPLDPEASHSLGLAWLRTIDVSARRIELITPIPVSRIHDALQHSQGLILVRGQLDNPDWTISEDQHIAQTERR